MNLFYGHRESNLENEFIIGHGEVAGHLFVRRRVLHTHPIQLASVSPSIYGCTSNIITLSQLNIY